jgi:hypothetical protein
VLAKGPEAAVFGRDERSGQLGPSVWRYRPRFRVVVLTVLLCGLTLLGAVGGRARSAGRQGVSPPCGWHTTPLPSAVGLGSDVTSISQPPRGGPWAIDSLNGVILHWDGGRWVTVSSPGSPDSVLALSNTDVWFGGGSLVQGLDIEHWNGRSISAVSNDATGGDFGLLAGTQANSVWLLSYTDEDTFLARWNGSTWSQARPPKLAGNPAQSIAARGESDVWVVGGWYPPAVLAHWDGSGWHLNKSRIFTQAGLAAVLDLGPRNVWGVGASKILHFDGTRWKVTPGPALAGSYFGPEVAGLRHGPIYAAGAGGNRKALLLQWTGNRWVRVATPPLQGSSEFDALAVGRDGEVWAGGETYRESHGNDTHDRAFIEHCVPPAQTGGDAGRGGY